MKMLQEISRFQHNYKVEDWKIEVEMILMGAKIDLRYWVKKYEDDYPKDSGGNYPVYIDNDSVEHEEKSPYFDTMSTVLQKRGYLLKKEFVSIGKWKTWRQTGRYESNSDLDVENITKKALRASSTDRIKILCELRGVKVPVASAILTTVYPKEYCVIDYRTWRALLWLSKVARNEEFKFTSYKAYSGFLDRYDTYNSVRSYFEFLNILSTIGKKRNMTPRQVEMALWKFDQLKGKKGKTE